MDDVDGEVGQKMRSAIKAKLTELGCYVDDELPDYVMVMVANKRTRSQMEDDLQLFLGDNTELFVNWLHQVLKKLQEVSAAPAPKSIEVEKNSQRSIKLKEKKSKDRKEKSKKGDSSKKSKKKAKEKAHKKKDEKKKSKKKSKHEMIRPNIPPLLMNIEKVSEPSITDVFAGQILKNHGVIIDSHKDEPKVVEQKPVVVETKRPTVPIIDPATIPSQSATTDINAPDTTTIATENETDKVPTIEDMIKETNEIELEIEEAKEKLIEQNEKADSTDDEDFLNIRTEADELINDFGDDVVFKEVSQPILVATPPLRPRKPRSPSPSSPISKKKDIPKDIPETLPQIELNLPKRPVRERLGAPTQKKDAAHDQEKRGKTTEKAANSPERNTPEIEPSVRPHKSAKSRLGLQEHTETRKRSTSDESEKSESTSKRLTSRVSVLDNRPSRVTCASVVRVRPRPRAAPASSLLLRAVADAHKSLLNIPPKVEPEPQKVKRALVLPMRRNVDPKKIVIQVPCTETNTTTTDSISDNVSVGEFESDEEDKSFKVSNVTSKDEYTPFSITKVIQNTEYIPSRTLLRKDDFVETIDIHNTTVDKDKGTQFIVTMDGFNPNAFLAKKLMTEGLLNDDEEILTISKDSKKSEGSKKGVLRHISERIKDGEINVSETTVPPVTINVKPLNEDVEKDTDEVNVQVKRPILEKRDSMSIEMKQNIESIDRPVLQNQKSDKSDKLIEENRSDMENLDKETLESDFSVENSIVERHDSATSIDKVTDKRKSDVALESSPSETGEAPPAKRRKASPIIFDVNKKEKEGERVRERTVSASSDSHVILTTASNTHKYDTLPPLSQAAKPPAPVWCRAFPSCRYGSSCAFAHPRCKFAAACTRRGCVYSHAHVASPVAAAAPVVASHVVPAANYKTISAGAFANICKYYPNCTNPTCHFYHPKPCRYGKACANKLECNFYHVDVPGGKWKYPV